MAKPLDTTPDWDNSILVAMKRLGGGPLTNAQIRAFFDAGHPLNLANDDGSKVGEALQALKKAGKVRLEKAKWWLVSLKECPTCQGKGSVPA